MRYQEVELSAGDVLRIGDHLVTVIDVDDSEASFRVDDAIFDQLGSDCFKHLEHPAK